MREYIINHDPVSPNITAQLEAAKTAVMNDRAESGATVRLPDGGTVITVGFNFGTNARAIRYVGGPATKIYLEQPTPGVVADVGLYCMGHGAVDLENVAIEVGATAKIGLWIHANQGRKDRILVQNATELNLYATYCTGAEWGQLRSYYTPNHRSGRRRGVVLDSCNGLRARIDAHLHGGDGITIRGSWCGPTDLPLSPPGGQVFPEGRHAGSTRLKGCIIESLNPELLTSGGAQLVIDGCERAAVEDALTEGYGDGIRIRNSRFCHVERASVQGPAPFRWLRILGTSKQNRIADCCPSRNSGYERAEIVYLNATNAGNTVSGYVGAPNYTIPIPVDVRCDGTSDCWEYVTDVDGERATACPPAWYWNLSGRVIRQSDNGTGPVYWRRTAAGWE